MMQSTIRKTSLRDNLLVDLPLLSHGDHRNFGSAGLCTFTDLVNSNSPIGPGLDFSDVDATLILPVDETIGYPCTVEIVFIPDDLGTEQKLFQWPLGGTFSTNPQTAIDIDQNHTEVSLGANAVNAKSIPMSSLNVNEVNHLIVTWRSSPINSDNCTGWINGVDATQTASGTNSADENLDFCQLGKRIGSPPWPYTGSILAFKMWDREISAAEALELYRNPWAPYLDEEDILPLLIAAAASGGSSFSPFWAIDNNQII